MICARTFSSPVSNSESLGVALGYGLAKILQMLDELNLPNDDLRHRYCVNVDINHVYPDSHESFRG